ncbi:MAG: D-alanyl-D-alanine carboxypeptidase/D-alanyl-D-alanine-endopeptidase [Tannerella sp.]|nr:D-alanyl-D-alanine carboxypeptidase/D-alanyl-D-alanine-endopeptidase [Tannerella sp.]
MKKFLLLFIALTVLTKVEGQTHPAIERFTADDAMRGASISMMVRNVANDSVVFSFDPDREVIPASVMKVVTTSMALELLGEDFCYSTSLMYDGQVQDSVLKGNLYIVGSGDPSICSSEADSVCITQWLDSVRSKGIKQIIGAVIADGSVFDDEGISMKWLREDLGSYYGQGCYGINAFDNRYTLFLNTSKTGAKPVVDHTSPSIPSLQFHNHLITGEANQDSNYIIGSPYSNDRFLYGVVPSGRTSFAIRGDIPDPPLFLAQYLTDRLRREGITVIGVPVSRRQLVQEGKWNDSRRTLLATTSSRPLKELVRITNNVSANLYADAFLKTIGLKYKPTGNEVVSSFDRGVLVLREALIGRKINASPLWMFDGSGLAPTDKVTARFLCDLLCYMATKSPVSSSFVESLPLAGVEGTVRTTLQGSALQGKVRLKSGSMSRVRSYAGYITAADRRYVVAIVVNNFSCRQSQVKPAIEQLLLALPY